MVRPVSSTVARSPARWLHRSSSLIRLLALCLSLACFSPEPPPVESTEHGNRPRHVILISVDTLRADYLGSYGHPWIETPDIDDLASESIRFERVIAAAPTTLASHVSMMTGLYPRSHGVPANGYSVPETNLTLAEILDDRGFTTVGFTGGRPLKARHGFAQGFQEYVESPAGGRHFEHGEELTDAVLEWLRSEAAADQRLFLFVHYWDVHWPYSPPPPFDSMYGNDSNALRGTFEEIKKVRVALKKEAANAPRQSEMLKRRYAAGVSYVDGQIGRLLDGLADEELLQDALVVLTSDHGESMDTRWPRRRLARYYWNHRHTVDAATVTVPLIVRLPGRSIVGEVPHYVSSVDIMPTILDLLKVTPPPSVEGVSLRGAFPTSLVSWERGPIFSEATGKIDGQEDWVWPNEGKCRGVWSSGFKLEVCPSSGERHLFDLARDPQELTDLLLEPRAKLGSISDRLHRELRDWEHRTAGAGRGKRDESPATLEELRSLGYLN